MFCAEFSIMFWLNIEKSYFYLYIFLWKMWEIPFNLSRMIIQDFLFLSYFFFISCFFALYWMMFLHVCYVVNIDSVIHEEKKIITKISR